MEMVAVIGDIVGVCHFLLILLNLYVVSLELRGGLLVPSLDCYVCLVNWQTLGGSNTKDNENREKTSL